MVQFFSPEIQGFYMTFWSVIGLQMFFELAFPQTIVTMTSHLWSDLDLDEHRRLIGEKDAVSRLTHLIRISVLVQVALAASFAILASAFGLWFFSDDPAADVINWRLPWLTLVGLSSIAFALIPFLAVLEGCGQVREIHKLNLLRGVAGSAFVWLAIPLGAELWVPAIATAVRLVCEVGWLLGKFPRFFYAFTKSPMHAKVAWRQEIWPFQSKMMVKGFFHYFNADVMLPILFRYQDSVAAGQFGMTWNIVQSIRMACSSWVRTRVPHFGVLIARKEYAELDRIFFRVGKIALALMFILGAIFLLGVFGLGYFDCRYAHRFLSAEPTALLIIGLWMALVFEFQWLYLHAHGKSPYLILNLIGCCLSGLLFWWSGFQYGVMGMSVAFLFMQGVVYLPLSTVGWIHLRKQWHEQAAEHP
ncbi:lipopolysaccharide biosynthesis protein [Rhodopirellula halodulae]|uniref:lipopolysaccharide biosynthesis protein n=1 Tax=Rhodopirellula halodulae TaxID=2894198 RepID=UPI0028F40365|nr:hypothetical protein [Rhodopirellula sp. JC737]